MKRKSDMKKRIWPYVGIVLAVCLIGGLVFAAWSVWQEYSRSILKVQEDQMLNTVDTVASNLEHEINIYQEDTNRLANIAEYSRENQDEKYVEYTLTQYLETKSDSVNNAIVRDENGMIISGKKPLEILETYDTYNLGDGVIFSEQMDTKNHLYFVFQKQTESGITVEIDVSVRSYYEDLLYSVQIGTNGYLVVKTSGGIILMHPEEEQWGINVIEGREALYGIEELQSLKDMTEKQLKGETGVAEYVSYWWGNENLPEVKKISAYTPAYVGDDYLVVSAVIDYDDLYKPIFDGYTQIGALFFGLFVVVLALILIYTYLAFQKKKNLEEIEYLKDLNEILEKTRQSEEVISHQQRLQIMGTMTGGIAHEFNNMLTPIMGYSDMLLDMLQEGSDEYDYVKEIFDASERAKDVIQQISSLSRKNMETVFTFIPVKKLLNRTMKMVHSVCPVNVRIVLEDKFKKEGFLGNETQMKQVILNLCVNAFHAIGKEAEGVLTILGTIENRDEIESRHHLNLANEWNQYICLRISDNGCGMSQETMEQIFTPFFTTKKTGKGTGLGLSVAEQIVHSHKGYICVNSKLGEGSDFYLYLPMQEAVQLSSKKEIAQLSTEKKRYLIVDDNEKILELLRKEFTRLKIEVKTIETPKEAKAELERTQYHLILIDETLAENHSGINFVMSIQNQYPDMRKILMVDQVKKEVIEAIQQHIIDGYVEKPVSSAGIIEKLRELEGEDVV